MTQGNKAITGIKLPLFAYKFSFFKTSERMYITGKSLKEMHTVKR